VLFHCNPTDRQFVPQGLGCPDIDHPTTAGGRYLPAFRRSTAPVIPLTWGGSRWVRRG